MGITGNINNVKCVENKNITSVNFVQNLKSLLCLRITMMPAKEIAQVYIHSRDDTDEIEWARRIFGPSLPYAVLLHVYRHHSDGFRKPRQRCARCALPQVIIICVKLFS